MTWRVDVGDCVELMAAMDASSVDAVVCDPPYGLEFMGKEWDRLGASATHRQDRASELGEENKRRYLAAGVTFGVSARSMQAWHEAWAAEALRVLKPGGHLLAFGGTRTSHRLACAIEDAGFEIRDTICWLYGSGFPKSLDVGKAIDKQAGAERVDVAPSPRHGGGIVGNGSSYELPPEPHMLTAPATPDAERWDGWGTALKPAHEPIVVARKPLAGTVAANVLEHGTGALNIDGGRVASPDKTPYPDAGYGRHETDATYALAGDPKFKTTGKDNHPAARWPPNVALDPEAAEQLDRQSGEGQSRIGRPRSSGEPGNGWGMTATGAEDGDSGGASRFFYTAKASRAERNAGLDGFEESKTWAQGHNFSSDPRMASEQARNPSRNHHPTVKPVNLMRWLCRLVTPPGGLILDPFTGSGTTGIAAVLEGFPFAGCEQDADYAAIAEARIGWWELHGHDALRIVAEQEAAEQEREAIRATGQLELL